MLDILVILAIVTGAVVLFSGSLIYLFGDNRRSSSIRKSSPIRRSFSIKRSSPIKIPFAHRRISPNMRISSSSSQRSTASSEKSSNELIFEMNAGYNKNK